MSSQNVQNLFSQAIGAGNMGAQSGQVLNIPDMGIQIQQGLGVNADDVPASEVILLSILTDDSGSINMAGNEQIVRDGHNLVLESLLKSKQEDNILVQDRYLNGTLLTPYVLITQAPKMDMKNYQANGGTPLYDMTAVILGSVLAKTQEFANAGTPVRSVTLIITDGDDQHSTKMTADKVKVIVDDMVRRENHIVAAMGIQDGHTNFKKVFKAMGIPDQWILTPGNSESEIRKAFQVFSQSVTKVSQNSAAFSQAALGGFGS
jgi:uncharacterized protein YegL